MLSSCVRRWPKMDLEKERLGIERIETMRQGEERDT